MFCQKGAGITATRFRSLSGPARTNCPTRLNLGTSVRSGRDQPSGIYATVLQAGQGRIRSKPLVLLTAFSPRTKPYSSARL